jgi:hypothetical protein
MPVTGSGVSHGGTGLGGVNHLPAPITTRSRVSIVGQRSRRSVRDNATVSCLCVLLPAQSLGAAAGYQIRSDITLSDGRLREKRGRA